MRIERVAYSYVEHGGPVPTPVLRLIPDEIATYLEEHRLKLATRASEERIAEAIFASDAAARRFETLRSGSDDEFVQVAVELARRLHQRMDGRSKKGFFVAATFSEPTDGTKQSVALKLDANEQKLAAIGKDKDGPTLQTVDDLLDLPGDLQKGAVFPDPRPESSICVGDKDRQASLYFLETVEVAQRELPGLAIPVLLGVVNKVAPEKVEPVTRALERLVGRTDVAEVLAAVEPGFSDEALDDVRGRLQNLKRPVSVIDPSDHATMGYIEVDGISVKGPADKIRDDVTWEADPDSGGYIIRIPVSQQPDKRYA